MLKWIFAFLMLPGLAFAQDTVRLKVLSFNIWYGGDQVSFASVIAAIKLADADIVGLQEPDGRTLEIAAAAGYPYADTRRHILSKYPLFDSDVGVTTSMAAPPYSIAGLNPDAVHVWAMVAPGRVVAVANTHLTSDPYGPELLRDGASADEVLANEAETRVPEAQALIDGLGPVAAAGVPVLLTGDFNTPSALDGGPVAWPVSGMLDTARLRDTFRTAHPDSVAVPGHTWTPGRPWPMVPAGETAGRIDYVYAANATVVESILVGEPGNPAVGLSVAPWPSDHRAVLSTVDVVPAEAPALVTTEPRPVVAGGSFVIRAHMPGGGPWTAVVVAPGADWTTGVLIGIADVDLADRPTLRLSTMGLAVGSYDAVLIRPGADTGVEVARHRFSVIPADRRAQIAATFPVVPGGDIALRFSGAAGFKLDWVGVYRKGEMSVYNYLGFAYTGARHEGDLVFPAAELYEDLTPGDYELRLLLDDAYQVQAVGAFTVQ